MLCILLQENVRKILKNSKSIENIIASFVSFKRNFEDVQTFVEGKRPEHLKQPLILAVGDTMDEDVDYYVVINNVTIHCGRDFVYCFKVLYASYYVFDLNYPLPLLNFFKFFDEVIFGVNNGVSPSVGSFVAKLDSVSRNNNALED